MSQVLLAIYKHGTEQTVTHTCLGMSSHVVRYLTAGAPNLSLTCHRMQFDYFHDTRSLKDIRSCMREEIIFMSFIFPLFNANSQRHFITHLVSVSDLLCVYMFAVVITVHESGLLVCLVEISSLSLTHSLLGPPGHLVDYEADRRCP